MAMAVAGLVGIASGQAYIPNCAVPVLDKIIAEYVQTCTEAYNYICFCKNPVALWYYTQYAVTDCPNETDSDAAVGFITTFCKDIGYPITFPIPDPNVGGTITTEPTVEPPASSTSDPEPTEQPTEPPASSTSDPNPTEQPTEEPSGTASSSSTPGPSSTDATSSEATTIVTSTRAPTSSPTCTATQTGGSDGGDCTCDDDGRPSSGSATGTGKPQPSAPVIVNAGINDINNYPYSLGLAGIFVAAAGLF